MGAHLQNVRGHGSKRFGKRRVLHRGARQRRERTPGLGLAPRPARAHVVARDTRLTACATIPGVDAAAIGARGKRRARRASPALPCSGERALALLHAAQEPTRQERARPRGVHVARCRHVPRRGGGAPQHVGVDAFSGDACPRKPPGGPRACGSVIRVPRTPHYILCALGAACVRCGGARACGPGVSRPAGAAEGALTGDFKNQTDGLTARGPC